MGGGAGAEVEGVIFEFDSLSLDGDAPLACGNGSGQVNGCAGAKMRQGRLPGLVRRPEGNREGLDWVEGIRRTAAQKIDGLADPPR